MVIFVKKFKKNIAFTLAVSILGLSEREGSVYARRSDLHMGEEVSCSFFHPANFPRLRFGALPPIFT
jgi:hypothetical protein